MQGTVNCTCPRRTPRVSVKAANALRTAVSCLKIQLCAYQEMRVPTMPMYLSDDATESELAEMTAEMRELARQEGDQR